MGHSSGQSVSDAAGWDMGARISRKLFDRALSPFTAGKLRVIYPSGEEVSYGMRTPGPEATIRILRPAFFKKVALYGEVGFGESYVDGDWETDDVVSVLSWFLINLDEPPPEYSQTRQPRSINLLLFINRLRHRLRSNNLKRARRNISDHYDLGNDFFRLFLDKGMAYSCAYFKSPDDSLEEAQSEKFDLWCRKLKLAPTDHVLEIGGGWGGFAIHAARNYGCRVTSITLSKEQLKYATERAAAEGLSQQVEFLFADYRTVTGQYDKIISIEMIEAVGHEYFNAYFRKCHELLKKNGLLGIQAICCPDSRYEDHRRNVDWMQKHIFPGGLLPTIGIMNKAINETGKLQLHSLEEMGPHYARTLSRWREKFNHNLESVIGQGFDEKFIRKWNYYLTASEAAFRTRNLAVVQAVFTRPNNLAL